MGPIQGLTISDRNIGDYCVMDVIGESQSYIGVKNISKYYHTNLAGRPNVALNLARYNSMIDSYLLGVIAGIRNAVNSRGGSFVLIPPSNPAHSRTLEIAGLTKVVTMCENENLLREIQPNRL